MPPKRATTPTKRRQESSRGPNRSAAASAAPPPHATSPRRPDPDVAGKTYHGTANNVRVLRNELTSLNAEVAALRAELGLNVHDASPGDPSVSSMVRTMSPATQAALEGTMLDLAEARRKAGIGTHAPGAGPQKVASPREGDGAGLARTFSSEIYDKMLANPKLTAAQREKIETMKRRRMVKEGTLEGTLFDLAQSKRAAPGLAEGVPPTPAGMPPVIAHHTSADGGLARTLSQLAAKSGVSKCAIGEVLEVVPTYTVADLRLLFTGFKQLMHVDQVGHGSLSRTAFSAVLTELATDPVVGPLWATKGFAFFEIMFERFEHGEHGIDFVEFYCECDSPPLPPLPSRSKLHVPVAM
jgi:hypothetical protein